MNIEYSLRDFLIENLELYIDTEYYTNNYKSIFIERAKKIYGGKTTGFLFKKPKSEHMYYVQYINDELALGDSQFSFLIDLDYARNFGRTYRRLLNYGKIEIKDNNGKSKLDFSSIVNSEFINSKITLEGDDLRDISVAKKFIKKYF